MNIFQKDSKGVVLKLIVKPGSRKNEIVGIFNDRIKIKIKSEPQEGKANKELIKYLALVLKIPKLLITIIKGEFSREKDVLIENAEINYILDRMDRFDN